MTFVFVYGTLAPGLDAWPVLEQWAVGLPQPDTIRGRLYDTGLGYPAATPDPSADALIHGVVVEIDRKCEPEALAALDHYEGDQYKRIRVRTESGIDAYTYRWTAPLDRCIAVPGGRWSPQA